MNIQKYVYKKNKLNRLIVMYHEFHQNIHFAYYSDPAKLYLMLRSFIPLCTYSQVNAKEDMQNKVDKRGTGRKDTYLKFGLKMRI